MGIIKKQAVQNSIWSYAGIILGFINIGILSPRFFTTEEVGLTQVLISIATILSQVATLGMGNVAMRIFPVFRDIKNKHNGFIGLSLLVGLFGFIVISLITIIFKPYFLESNIEKSSLMVSNFGYVIPLIFFMLFFSIFDSYNRMLYNAVLGPFLKDFFLRASNTVVILLFVFKLISFDIYVLLFVFVQSMPMIIIGVVLWQRDQLTCRFNRAFITRNIRREIIDVALFGIISSLSGLALENIDRLMVNQYIGLNAAGIYSVTFFFGALILVPQRAIFNISTTIISEAWKKNDLDTIEDIYIRSSINQFMVGIFIFVGIWGNINNVFQILGNDYSSGKWVIFFISLSNLSTALAGGGMFILVTSKYYRYRMWLMIFLILLVVSTNVIFIPIWGLTGAAFASFLSMFLYNVSTFWLLKIKFKIHPLKWNHLGLLLVGLLTYFISELLPPFSNFLIDILVRSAIITVIFASFTFLFKLSKELSEIVYKTFKLNNSKRG